MSMRFGSPWDTLERETKNPFSRRTPKHKKMSPIKGGRNNKVKLVYSENEEF